MHTTLDRKICEHVEFHVFVSPHSSRQHGIHTSRVCRVYLSLRSRPHFVSHRFFRDRKIRVRNCTCGLKCEIALDGAVTGPIQEE